MKAVSVLIVFLLLLVVPFSSAEIFPLIQSPTIQNSNTAWDYEAKGGYEVYFNENLNAGYSVLFSRKGAETQLLPHSLQFRNDLNQLELISMPQSVIGVPTSDKTFFYDEGYGTGVDLVYTIDEFQVKEELIFANAPTPPAQYIIDGGNPVIELNFQIGGAGRIFIEDVEWEGDNDIITNEAVLVKNLAGETVYTLPTPIATDNNGNIINGSYEFKSSANKIYVGIRIPYSFFETANYPVTIDPTFFVDYSPIPAEWLINGNVATDNDNEFLSVSDITIGVSDLNDLTNYETVRDLPTYNTIIDHTDGTYESIDYLAGNNEIMASDFNLTGLTLSSLTFCTYSTENSGADARVSIGTTIYPSLDVVLPTGTSPSQFTCIDIPTNLLIDGVNRIGIGCYANCGGSKRIYFAEDIDAPTGNSYYFNTVTWQQEPHDHADYIIFNTTDNTTGKAISGHWNVTYEPQYDYFLRLKKYGAGTNNVTVRSYDNETSVNGIQVTETLAGTGWFSINITDIVNYETTVKGLDYTQVRFYSHDTTSFSEVALRVETNDTISPTINSYNVEATDFGCLESSNIYANITDNIEVNNVTFTINGNEFSAIKNEDIYNYVLSSTDNGTTVFEWQNIRACDIYNQCSNINPEINITYSCSYEDYINIQHNPTVNNGLINLTNSSVSVYWTTSNLSDSRVNYGETTLLGQTQYSPTNLLEHYLNLADLVADTLYYYEIVSVFNPNQTSGLHNFTTLSNCQENWVNNPLNQSICRTNNTILQLNNYIDLNACGTNETFPYLLNGTITEEYCNYCNPDWNELTGGIYECQSNSTRYVEYLDYNSCYIQTGLIEDAPPLDHQTWVSCVYYISDFTCTIAEKPYLKDKMEYSCVLPNSVEDYECINSITYGFDDVLQVNPQRQERADGFMIIQNKVELRESFTTRNGLLNAYFTNKNLVAETPFTITTTCSNGNNTLVHQKEITPTYKNIDEVPTYAIWVKDNAPYLVVGFIMILIVIWFVAYLIGQSKYR